MERKRNTDRKKRRSDVISLTAGREAQRQGLFSEGAGDRDRSALRRKRRYLWKCRQNFWRER